MSRPNLSRQSEYCSHEFRYGHTCGKRPIQLFLYVRSFKPVSAVADYTKLQRQRVWPLSTFSELLSQHHQERYWFVQKQQSPKMGHTHTHTHTHMNTQSAVTLLSVLQLPGITGNQTMPYYHLMVCIPEHHHLLRVWVFHRPMYTHTIMQEITHAYMSIGLVTHRHTDTWTHHTMVRLLNSTVEPILSSLLIVVIVTVIVSRVVQSRVLCESRDKQTRGLPQTQPPPQGCLPILVMTVGSHTHTHTHTTDQER